MANHVANIVVAFMAVLLLAGSDAKPWDAPYDQDADPAADLSRATEAAVADDRLLLLIFGANWCPDCRVFDKAMYDPDIAPVVAKHFQVIKVDVGNWDHNLDFVALWGNPIEGGIPAIVVADADHNVLYDTKAGEMSTARRHSQEEFVAFFERLASYR